ncbi:MAG: hypothetical protein P4M08_11655 [Oligoflexia bacterium]|nr:hypothetical protein [Oligoflexia bacterium]
MRSSAGVFAMLTFLVAGHSVPGYSADENSPPAAPILRSMRDPFKLIQTDAVEMREKSDLENVPIEDIRVVAILTGPTRTRAVVKLGAANKTYVVGEGMRVGTDEEIIEKITSRGVMLVGSRINVVGDRETVTTELPLIPEDKKQETKPNSVVSSPEPQPSLIPTKINEPPPKMQPVVESKGHS